MTAARIVIAAPRSGEGKTTVALGLMAALRERGLHVQGFKVGPDYLDTGYQRFAAGVPGRNLDLFMMGEEAVRAAIEAANADVAVIEGVMGLFDGHRDGITPTSTADVARLLAAPVVLVLDAARMAASAGAVALGFRTFDPRVDVRAVILNHWNQGRDKSSVQAAMERAGVEVLGYLPSGEGLDLPSRHLGLVVADELGDQATTVVERLGTTLAQYVDLDRLLALAAEAPPLPAASGGAPVVSVAGAAVGTPQVASAAGSAQPGGGLAAAGAGPARIAVAWDDAFAFYYADNLALLQAHGAELIFFSPLTASDLPVCDGLYLGGGYPELHADGLSANVALRRNLAAALRAGLPTYAECGGLLYLCHSLVDLDGRSWPLIGAVPGRAAMHDKLQGMGYREASFFSDSLLGPRGAIVRGHEFHYSSCVLESDDHPAYLVDGLPEGYAAGNLFASYIHLHFAGYPAVVEHWLDRCRTYAGSRSSGGQTS